jgi:hypothetical protein
METQADNQTQETKDNEIRDTLDQEFDGASKGTPEEWFHRARDLGASWEFAGLIAARNMRDREGKSLPWVKFLINVGCPKEVIQSLLEENCFRHPNSTLGDTDLFLADQSAWEAFSDTELQPFLIRLTERGVGMLNYFHLIERRLGREQALKIMEIQLKSVNGSLFVRTDEELAVLQGFPENLREMAALRTFVDWRTTPFIIRTLKYKTRYERGRPVRYFRVEEEGVSDFPRLFSDRWLLRNPATYRWALLGGDPYPLFGFKNDILEGANPLLKLLRQRVGLLGWRFAKLERDGDKLVVRDNSRHGMRVVYEHDNNGPRGDQLKEGDEVMVPQDHRMKFPRKHINDLTSFPFEKIGNDIVIKMEFHPPTLPTSEMLRDPEYYFHGKDLLPSK